MARRRRNQVAPATEQGPEVAGVKASGAEEKPETPVMDKEPDPPARGCVKDAMVVLGILALGLVAIAGGFAWMISQYGRAQPFRDVDSDAIARVVLLDYTEGQAYVLEDSYEIGALQRGIGTVNIHNLMVTPLDHSDEMQLYFLDGDNELLRALNYPFFQGNARRQQRAVEDARLAATPLYWYVYTSDDYAAYDGLLEGFASEEMLAFYPGNFTGALPWMPFTLQWDVAMHGPLPGDYDKKAGLGETSLDEDLAAFLAWLESTGQVYSSHVSNIQIRLNEDESEIVSAERTLYVRLNRRLEDDEALAIAAEWYTYATSKPNRSYYYDAEEAYDIWVFSREEVEDDGLLPMPAA